MRGTPQWEVVLSVLVGLAAGCASEPSSDPHAPGRSDPVWIEYESRRALDVPRPGQRVGQRVRIHRSGRVTVARLVRADTDPAAAPREDTATRGRLTSRERGRLKEILEVLPSGQRPDRRPEDHSGRRPCRTPASSVRLTVHTDTASRTVGMHRGCDPARYPEAFRRAFRDLTDLMERLRGRLEPPDNISSEAAAS